MSRGGFLASVLYVRNKCARRKFYLINSDRSRVEGYDEGSDKGNRGHEKRGERERTKKERKRGSKIVSRRNREREREGGRKCGKSEELIEVGKGAKR